ncbi:hypothetical protein IHE55_28255 [Streptomyces pactum]|uniref:Uncharacterized protein n=1 Tax=Streptomyces pactum TaxID=68249 RepID=A0ABS0NTC7_9ACTN|nr:hypothetical protein [Streptomyces pactum]MBH5338471.1 hypothetical protein [Streptomyces pactum]
MAEALRLLSYDPLASRVFCRRTPAGLRSLADWVCERDPYGELPRLRAALRLVEPHDDDPRAHIGHQLWCAWRQACWTAGVARPLPAVVASGRQWLDETRGHPTVLVAPMTMTTADALHTVSAVFADRRVVALGEGTVPRYGARLSVVNGDVGSIRQVLRHLAAGGVLGTYADFVYAGRDARPTTLFGRTRPVSAGFVAVASRPGTMLLPTVMRRTDDERIAMEFDEPLLVRGLPREARAARESMLGLIAEILEGLIRRNPRQWLLLPTLSFDSPQLARA